MKTKEKCTIKLAQLKKTQIRLAGRDSPRKIFSISLRELDSAQIEEEADFNPFSKICLDNNSLGIIPGEVGAEALCVKIL
jgi:hypothetical protein